MREPELPFLDDTLRGIVGISRQFLRSVRLDADLGRPDALSGYVCQGTAKNLLESMARQILQSTQRAFTWTGPYGGGKSSLALALCSLVGSDPTIRKQAARVLNLEKGDQVLSAFSATGNGWLVVPVVGRRESASSSIAAALIKAKGLKTPRGRKRNPISELVSEAAARPDQGVLLVVDELGKFLENAAQTGEDIYFYQELAEAAGRSHGKLIIVGILHQAFEAYASRLGREIQEEWAKVQGRYIDIPLVTATDEVIELTARSLATSGELELDKAAEVARRIAESIGRRRAGAPRNLGDALARCWPLHPVTAALLGPFSRRRYGQNDRSIFGFLASREPLGFSEFLDASPVAWDSMYSPARFWDYLRANLEPAILASSDAHRWASGVDAVMRAESRGTTLHINLIKTIALVEMFRNTAGLAADQDVLRACFPSVEREELDSALTDLSRWSVVLFRKHIDAWGVFAGSDFDIDQAMNQAIAQIGEPDLAQAVKLTDLGPLVAKRLYHQTGSMRWFTRTIVQTSELENYLQTLSPTQGSTGELALVLPSLKQPLAAARKRAEACSSFFQPGQIVLLGVPENGARISELAADVTALERVFSTRPELEGDLVARRELDARMSSTRVELEEELRAAFAGATWYFNGSLAKRSASEGLPHIISRTAAEIYNQAPRFFSEILNRDSPSSNAAKARRELMYRMLTNSHKKDLGYVGFPADAGLYFTLLKSTRLHREVSPQQWGFCAPDEEDRGPSLQPLWEATQQLVNIPDKVTSVAELYRIWSAPPFGVKSGLHPVLALVFYLSNRQNLAMYLDGVFSPEVSEVQIDQWVTNATRISFRYVTIAGGNKRLLEELAPLLTEAVHRPILPEPLEVARALVALVFSVPGWTRRTSSLSIKNQKMRALLLKASDPHKVLFTDLPVVLQATGGEELGTTLRNFIDDLGSAYHRMLNGVMERVLDELDSGPLLEALRVRAEAVADISGDQLLNAFINRLRTFEGKSVDIEALISLAASKPSRDWVDRDIDASVLRLCDWARQFRRLETLASVRNRPSNRHTLTIMVGTGDGEVSTGEFDVSLADKDHISSLAKDILARASQERREVFLAALAEAGTVLMNTDRGAANGG